MHVTELYLSFVDFDDDSESLKSTSSYLLTWYLCNDKSNALSIFMLSGSI